MPRTVYFAQNQAAAGTLTGAPVTKRAEFIAAIPSAVSSNGLEANGLGHSVPITMIWTGSAGNIVGVVKGGITMTTASEAGGLFNTTVGGNVLLQATLDFYIDFATPISAFGCYGVDIGDTVPYEDVGSWSVSLRDTQGFEETLSVPHATPGSQGNLLFWGFIDTTKSYDRITLKNSNTAGMQYFGFDDFVVADANQVQPIYWPASCSAWPGGNAAR